MFIAKPDNWNRSSVGDIAQVGKHCFDLSMKFCFLIIWKQICTHFTHIQIFMNNCVQLPNRTPDSMPAVFTDKEQFSLRQLWISSFSSIVLTSFSLLQLLTSFTSSPMSLNYYVSTCNLMYKQQTNTFHEFCRDFVHFYTKLYCLANFYVVFPFRLQCLVGWIQYTVTVISFDLRVENI